MRRMFLLALTVIIHTACSNSQFSGESPSTKKEGTTENRNSGNQQPYPQAQGNGQDDTVNENNVRVLPVDIEFRRFADGAAWNNCISLKINDQPDVEVGCNKDPNNRVTTLKIKSKPFCNIVRFTLKSNGNFNFSTENIGSIRVGTNGSEDLAHFEGMKLFRESNDVLKVMLNDNGDSNNSSDTTFRLYGLSKIFYKIENGEKTCQKS